ncbi:MAG: phytase [Arenimonas sp.]|uniref:phytase n=1 Tax=Arenimonas sp. TaxID=1872635 RepID=UPI0025C67CB6|nr:phytase [Arenimonas sp.]MBW8368567.1 phytase [Arenimonas sp.]
MRPTSLALCLIPLLLAGCASTPDREPDEVEGADPLLSASGEAHVTVAEAFVSALTPKDNIDSPAAWRAPDGKTWLFATAKEGKGLVVYDGDTGATLRTVGTEGSRPGQFKRPNGVAVSGDHLFVVERDNRRVQVLWLPSLATVATFGEAELKQPYGLFIREHASGELEVLVTDAYMIGEDANGDDIPPPLAQLDRRVQRYLVRADEGAVSAISSGAFGDTTAQGAIRVPESIWGDVANDRLLIAEEDVATGTGYREYSMAGDFRGKSLGVGRFKAQAEGVTLWSCPDGSGYWLATDQFKDLSLFHVFDRQTLEHVGAFAGKAVANTDGVWLQQSGTQRFPQGVFYAVHDDMAVGAFDWSDIAAALNLRKTCEGA